MGSRPVTDLPTRMATCECPPGYEDGGCVFGDACARAGSATGLASLLRRADDAIYRHPVTLASAGPVREAIRRMLAELETHDDGRGGGVMETWNGKHG